MSCRDYQGAQGAWPCTPGKGQMVTERYFCAFTTKGKWVVWDRAANEQVAEYPRSQKGRALAHAKTDELNALVRARKES